MLTRYWKAAPDGPKHQASADSDSLQRPSKKNAALPCSSLDVAAGLRSRIDGVEMEADNIPRPTSIISPRPKKETAPCYFLKLPAELRNMIYRMIVIPQKTAVRPPQSRLTRSSHRTNTAILRTNRQIYMEARFVLYRNSTFEADLNSKLICATPSDAAAFDTVQQCKRPAIQAIFPHVLAEVCHVKINLYYSESMDQYTRRLIFLGGPSGLHLSFTNNTLATYENVRSQAESICKAIWTRSDTRRMRLTIDISRAMYISETLWLYHLFGDGRMYSHVVCRFVEHTRQILAMFDSLPNVEVELTSCSKPLYCAYYNAYYNTSHCTWRSQLCKELQARLDSKRIIKNEAGEA